MPINPMMYRVFLRDEKDVPNPMENPANAFRISSGKILSWYHNCPAGYIMPLDLQLREAYDDIKIGPSSRMVDGHLLIYSNGSTIGVVHTPEEIPEKAYSLARRMAEKHADNLARAANKPYVFIDLTSRGNPEEASRLSKIVEKEEVD